MKPLLFAGLLALACATAAPAQTWTERPFDPPVGSRWIVESETDSLDIRPDGTRTQNMRLRSELTIEAKLPDGFRVVYVNREATVGGSAAEVKLVGPAMEAMKGIVIRATTDRSGNPVRVENLEEVQTRMKEVIARMADAFEGKPKIQAMTRDLLTSLLIRDGQETARSYLEELSLLAVGHNTGLKPGETRKTAEDVPNPLGGGPLRSNLTLRIVKADPESGAVRLELTRSLDPAAITAFVMVMMKKIGAATGGKIPDELMAALKAMTIAIDSTASIDVENGMTSRLRETASTSARVMGQSLNSTQSRYITVTRVQ